MIRLAIIGAPAMRWQAIAARLRGVVVRIVDEPRSPAAFEECDGAAFFEPLTEDCTPIERCLDAGRPILLAANVCPSVTKLQTLSALARRNRTHFVVANCERYLPSRQLIRQQLDAGKLGEPGLIRLHRWEPPNVKDANQDLAGALLCDLDLVAWLNGQFPNLVYAVEQTAAGSSQRIGVQVHLGFSGGGMALVDSILHPHLAATYHSLTVIGSSGAAYVDDHQNMQVAFRQDDTRGVRMDEGFGHWSTLLQEFAETVQKPVNHDAYPTAWHNALMIGEAVRQSLRSGQAIVPEGLQ